MDDAPLSTELREIAANRAMSDRTRHLLRNLANRVECLEHDNDSVIAILGAQFRHLWQEHRSNIDDK